MSLSEIQKIPGFCHIDEKYIECKRIFYEFHVDECNRLMLQSGYINGYPYDLPAAKTQRYYKKCAADVLKTIVAEVLNLMYADNKYDDEEFHLEVKKIIEKKFGEDGKEKYQRYIQFLKERKKFRRDFTKHGVFYDVEYEARRNLRYAKMSELPEILLQYRDFADELQYHPHD